MAKSKEKPRKPTEPLQDARREAFAWARARGMKPIEACVEAGYARWHSQSGNLSADAAITARIEEIRQHLRWGGSRDLGPVIDAMMALALAKDTVKSAAGVMAAKSLMVEAARLKQLLPRARTVGTGPMDVQISHEEWLKRYGAKD